MDETERERDDLRGESDYYDVLGLTPAASQDEIRHAFRELAKRWHPDLFVNATPHERERAERRMRAIVVAHETLSDPGRRASYDLRRIVLPEHRAMPGSAVYYDTFTASGSAPTQNANSNGAGQVFGTLLIGLALAIVGRTLLRGGPQSTGAIVVEFAIVVGLFALAAFCYMEGSLIARAANSLIDGEPRPRGERYAAQEYEPRHHPEPETPVSDFERYVDEALSSIPDEFRERLQNVVVRVEDEPTEEELRSARVPAGHTLLGLYHGVPLTHHGIGAPQPEIVSIYRGPIERHCHHDAERIREQVRATTLHEIAHHFGIDHDEMPEWVKA